MLLEDYNFKPLKQKLSLNQEKNEKFFIFASSHRLSCRSFYRFREVFRLATEPRSFSTGLFLFHYVTVFKRFYTRANVAFAQNKRFRYLRLRLVFEKAFESFRLNNQKTQCEQRLRVDDSRSGKNEFSLIGWEITEAPLSYIHSKREATNHLPLRYLLEQSRRVPNILTR